MDIKTPSMITNKRLQLGLNRNQLARKIGCEFNQVSKWEKGYFLPSPFYLKCLCQVLGVSYQEWSKVVIDDILIREKQNLVGKFEKQT